MRCIVALLLVGCLPRPDAERVDPPEGAEQATAVVWEALDGPGPTPDVIWLEAQCGDGRGFIDPVDGTCTLGMTYSCDEMYVTFRERPSESAMIHELIHCLMSHRYGELDADHSRTEWALKQPIREVLMEQGL